MDREKIFLIWGRQPILDLALAKIYPAIYEKYRMILNDFLDSEFGIAAIDIGHGKVIPQTFREEDKDGPWNPFVLKELGRRDIVFRDSINILRAADCYVGTKSPFYHLLLEKGKEASIMEMDDDKKEVPHA